MEGAQGSTVWDFVENVERLSRRLCRVRTEGWASPSLKNRIVERILLQDLALKVLVGIERCARLEANLTLSHAPASE